ncbi:MAG: hypothetical protein KAS32_25135 [Candidatus Peribacteraceae bacterium]|nr:hypothetical protein [Candidatus Peribacteraceae bacterium]
MSSFEASVDLWYHLSQDVSVTTWVDTYLGSPAIFTSLPENLPDRYVYVPSPHTTLDASCKNDDTESSEQFRDIIVATKRTWNPVIGAMSGVEILASAVRVSLHRQEINNNPGGVPRKIEIIEALPSVMQDNETYFGRLIETRLIVRR